MNTIMEAFLRKTSRSGKCFGFFLDDGPGCWSCDSSDGGRDYCWGV